MASFEGFQTDDIHADLPHVEVPALLVVAGRGDVVRPEDIEEMGRLLPGLLVARVPNAGHMIPWDDEEGFYAAFADFLELPASA
jgi:N-formylmaleamate deformylase